jgi:serine/threonine protein kinase
MIPPDMREDWIIRQARERPVAERAAFLDGACTGDAALRQRLETLVGVQDQPDELLGNGMAAAMVEATSKLDLSDTPDEAISQTLGRYKLLEAIGEGGCGVVYVAEQTEPVRRRVALKVIKLGMDTKEVIARFEAERQALALMDHPNIAKVFDAGATDAGRPYFVMELVRGVRITQFCDERHLSVRERLDLFIKVCQAIQHAHQKGIIHRDIKPSNILVTMHDPDGSGVPKVIDFGIAKATEGRLTEATVYTQVDQFIGTPAYMSPEQVEMGGRDMDTRSDIYSLGVLLYELLTGVTPFDAFLLTASGLDTMRRTIREMEPVRPSTRFATLKEEESTVTAKRRSADKAKLTHQLQGDLDWIIMKCLEKDRSRRYETANGVAMDLERHLNNEPVVARPPSTLYRLEKSFRRNKLVFTAVAAVALALMLGVIISIWQAAKARQAAREARQQQARADDVATVLKNMLETVGPSVARGRDTTLLREILTNTVTRLDTEFTNRPQVEADLRFIIGKTYLDLGDYKAAAAMQQRVLELRKKIFGERSDPVGDALDELAKNLCLRGDLAEAERLERESLAVCRENHGANDLKVADRLNNLGIMLYDSGKLRESRDFYREALAIREMHLKPPNEGLATSHLNLSMLLADLEEFTEGERQARIALNAYRELYGESLPNDKIGMSLHNQAKHLRGLGRLDEAEVAIRKAIEIYTRLYPGGHTYLVEALDDLGLILQSKGDSKDAAVTLRQGIGMGTKVLGEDHPQTLQAMRHLALVLAPNAAVSTEAEELMQRAMSLGRKKLAKEPAVLATCLADQGTFLAQTGRPKEAEPVLLEAYGLLVQGAEISPIIKKVCRELEQLYGGLNRPDDARRWAAKLTELSSN